MARIAGFGRLALILVFICTEVGGNPSVGTPPRASITNVTPAPLRWLFSGRGARIHQFISSTIQRLLIPEDPDVFDYAITPGPILHGSISLGRSINVTLGTFAHTPRMIEGLLAHEISHANPDTLNLLVDSKVDEWLIQQVPELEKLSDSQREEIRCDLAASERLIRAKLSPWGLYDFLEAFSQFEVRTRGKYARFLWKHFGGIDLSAFRLSHPATHLRMLAIKAYVLYKKTKVDISDATLREDPHPELDQLRRWVKPYVYLAQVPTDNDG